MANKIKWPTQPFIELEKLILKFRKNVIFFGKFANLYSFLNYKKQQQSVDSRHDLLKNTNILIIYLKKT